MGDLSRIHVKTPPDKPRALPVRDPVGASLRLIGWMGVLIRYDALTPREITPLLPVWARWIAHLLHLFAGRESRQGRPGERLARACERLANPTRPHSGDIHAAEPS